jgi:ribosomal protein S18 acetylase RimI-like enzyme
MAQLTRAETDDHFAEARILFEEYARSLPLEDLEFQNFSEELESIGVLYTPPQGRLLLARRGEELMGCVAVRRIDDHVCEMKRLYVRALARRTGLGRRLALEIIAEAKSLGYSRMRLDTLPSMDEARTLYQSLGFKIIQPYYDTPIDDMVFMEIDL